VNVISDGSAPIAAANCLRDSSIARLAFAPNEYWLEALPYCSRRKGIIFSKALSDILVVAALSA
jgi:hypothetical protein